MCFFRMYLFQNSLMKSAYFIIMYLIGVFFMLFGSSAISVDIQTGVIRNFQCYIDICLFSPIISTYSLNFENKCFILYVKFYIKVWFISFQSVIYSFLFIVVAFTLIILPILIPIIERIYFDFLHLWFRISYNIYSFIHLYNLRPNFFQSSFQGKFFSSRKMVLLHRHCRRSYLPFFSWFPHFPWVWPLVWVSASIDYSSLSLCIFDIYYQGDPLSPTIFNIVVDNIGQRVRIIYCLCRMVGKFLYQMRRIPKGESACNCGCSSRGDNRRRCRRRRAK